MKEFKNARKNVGTAICRPHIEENAKGITLIALIITIVVMLILVVVSIRIALETGLFESAGKATKDWEEAQDKEQQLAGGKVTIGGVTYNSIGEYTNSIKTEENEEVDFEKLFATAEKHPEQTESNDIGIAEDGSIVNLDLWYYEVLLNGSYPIGYSLGAIPGTMLTGYYDNDVIDGKIQGKVPMYIKGEGNNGFYPVIAMLATFGACESLTEAPEIPSSVTNMESTFYNCRSLTEAPEIPSSVTNMDGTFFGCTSLTEAPVIPSSVTNMDGTFSGCTSLTEAPVIPSSVTNMRSTFSGCRSLTEAPAIQSSVTDMYGTFGECTSLTEAPVIPSSVTDMRYTFNGCTSLTGTLTINANPTDYSGCLSRVATNEGCNLVLNGSSTKLNEILATKSDNSNISLGS